jgi:hypothetical protein
VAQAQVQARRAKRRQGNCRKASSGRWSQSSREIGSSRQVIVIVRLVRAIRVTREAWGWRVERWRARRMRRVAVRTKSVAEEEIILDAHAGDGGHGDLDPSLLVCGRNDVEGGKGQAEEGSGCGAES